MTPVDEPRSSAELQYNMAHEATHEIVDRTFRAIQTRFRCLDGAKGYLQVSSSAAFFSNRKGRMSDSSCDSSSVTVYRKIKARFLKFGQSTVAVCRRFHRMV